MPYRVHGVGEVKSDARQAIDLAQTGVPLDEGTSVRQRQATWGRLDAGHRGAGYSRSD
jgi:hypothetical protein